MTASDPIPNSKTTRPTLWRFARFSLASLVLFVLLIGSAATAWWRWDAWVRRSSFTNKETITNKETKRAFFSADGSMLFLVWENWNEKLTKCFHTDTGTELDSQTSDTVSPDGHWVQTRYSDKFQEVLVRVRTKESKTLVELCDKEVPARFSPDSQLLLAVLPDNAIKVWSVEPFKELFATAAQAVKIDQFGFSPDSKWVYALGADGVARFWDAQTGKLFGALGGQCYGIQFLVATPDSRAVFAACLDAKGRIFTLPDLKVEAILDSFDDYLYAAAFSGDGRLLATSTWSGSVNIWGRTKNEQLATLRTADTRVNALAFSPDGTRIVTGGSDGAVRVWDTWGRQVLHFPAEIETNGFSPPIAAGATIAGKGDSETSGEPTNPESGQTESLAEAAWRKETPIEGHFDQIQEVRYIANGSMLLTCDISNSIRLWDADAGEPIIPRINCALIAATPDGRKVAVHKGGTKNYEIWELRRKQSESRLRAQPEIWFGGMILIVLLFNLYRNFRRARP